MFFHSCLSAPYFSPQFPWKYLVEDYWVTWFLYFRNWVWVCILPLEVLCSLWTLYKGDIAYLLPQLEISCYLCVLNTLFFLEMEATQKQRGSIKSKLAKSFGLGTNRTSQPHCSSKVRPSPSSLPPMNQNGSNHLSLQRTSYASSMPAPTATLSHPNEYVNAASNGYTNAAWGGYGGDENVDLKAENYISHVRERFNRFH